MKIVEKKIKPEFFEAVYDGSKNFELRRDENGFEVGDFIVLREWNESYTGRIEVRRITYVLRNYEGLQPGYCILGFR